METKKCFSSPGAFKAYATGREEPGDSHPIINEWGGAWACHYLGSIDL
jgi:hypothetical protein